MNSRQHFPEMPSDRAGSTAIDWAHWRNGTLTVKFHGGDIYDYIGVPEEVWRRMRISASQGRFVNREIKPHYAFRRRPPTAQ